MMTNSRSGFDAGQDADRTEFANRDDTSHGQMAPTLERQMTRQGWLTRCTLLLGTMGLLAASSGCQTTIGGQTLPSAHYLDDDIQFFPAGDEFLLPNQVRAIEEYRAAQAGFEADFGNNAGGGGGWGGPGGGGWGGGGGRMGGGY